MRSAKLAVLALPVLLVAADAPPPRAGAWAVTIHPNAIRLPPTLDKEQGAVFRQMMTQPIADRLCVKAADLAGGRALFAFRGEKSCRAGDVALSGRHVTGTAQCNESGQALEARLTGEYAPDRITYDVTRVKGGLDLPGTVMASVEMRRTGEC